ncbi:hypothetical protein SAMN05216464_102244 [Mucilaginibacter pineti]|uniref:Tail sheath protein C-terminal domain-containing protein n=1 Tax=Mucilaginibacter pineti TaxID=1391627 RepID=A0A1G6WQK1_9SPHI|nr:phage tail sheath C-terminal domain-containing protein [Mucilaginibacter pineti]SDD67325.1 hypothetical protein SAMN05216464_102244 [Mucilaginibacter pineti]
MAYKTPGVYVQEIALFPPSVAEVATAIPAFIGYTAFALTPDGKSLAQTPTRIQSLLEFETLYGGNYVQQSFTVTVKSVTNALLSIQPDKFFYLYTALRQYFDNGGGPCYIVSVGSFADVITYQPIADGIDNLSAYDEPTLIVFPDAVGLLDATNKPDVIKFSQLQNKSLALCASMQDRFSIFDLIQGDQKQDVSLKPIDNFRNSTGLNSLNYGAAYYPWIITSYPISVDFRQLAFQTDANPAVAITNYDAFSSNPVEKAFVTDLQNKIADTNSVLAKVFTTQADKDLLRIAGIDAIKAKLNVLVNALGNNVTPDTQLTNYLSLLALVVVSFKKVKDALAATSPLNVDVDRIALDTKLTDAIVKLISIEKNPKVQANNPGRTPKTTYTVLDGTSWLQTLTYDTVVAKADNYSHNAVGSLAIVQSLQDVVNTILSSFGALLSGALFYENQAEQALFAGNAFFNGVNAGIIQKMRTIPPSGSIAGVYAAVDNSRGVWKAPANVSLNNVIGPAVKIDSSDQDDMNVTSTGKSINAIRAFAGRGTLVWGARTLAGNDNEWRYVPVRRFFIMVEESVKKATYPFVFETNDANTWSKLRAMVQNFLTLQWRASALQGAKPEDAFFVNVGLGETMTALDVLEGRLIVEIGMAAVRPAEFIILRFSHKMLEN